MTEQHLIIPSPELVETWVSEALSGCVSHADWLTVRLIATRAAQYGADQELEACCEWLLKRDYWSSAKDLRAARRPAAPPTLAEEAYIAFVQICKGNSDDAGTYDADEALVRRALQRLQELENNQ